MRIPIAVLVRRLNRLPRPVRILELKRLVASEHEGTIRWKELRDFLQAEVTLQLKREIAA